MVSFQRSHVAVVTPPGEPEPSLAIAACRAEARGVLDLEFAGTDAALAAVARLARFTSTCFGVKVGPESAGSLLDALLAASGRLAWVWLTGGDHPELGRWVTQVRQQGREAWLEAVSLAEAQRGEDLGVNALVLKGHEAGGRVGPETAFILLQRWQAHVRRRAGSTPPAAWVQGGVGLRSAAACVASGAAGVVLDAQVLLARESSLSPEARQRLTGFDGSETVCLGESQGEAYRVCTRDPSGARLAVTVDPEQPKGRSWREMVHRLGVAGGETGLWFLGQDAALARPLAERYHTVAGIIGALVEQTEQNLLTARRLRPLAEGAALARFHRTRYPIVQGPMTRVSDTAAFAEAVARGGALPFLALALLRQGEAETLLKETRERLGDLPWGVGILGFVPAEIRNEQIAAIRSHRPPLALIAGGRPDQARDLENEGIPTYLHVPSPGLLRLFLRDGARRFVFEGRECGGHVGPRTSFVLWETMTEVLLEHLCSSEDRGPNLAVIFAGGIHDRLSAAMVAALAAPLAERGVAVGVLMGTAYLFTREAVASGAITARFQAEALACYSTVLLQTAPGHAIRCVPTPYCDFFDRERARLLAEGRSHEETVRALEWMNIGRLRLAAKGVDRAAGDQAARRLVQVPEEEQYARGMYMIGQLASLRDEVVAIDALHEDVCGASARRHWWDSSKPTAPAPSSAIRPRRRPWPG
jgi:NAD(P)H-dependent flavin oxidoreductase YrpB (nitropropane dioxygenase family)